MIKIEHLLSSNPYPGRGIIIGRSKDNESAVIVYFIMGRSINSRNRVFEKTKDGIRTKAFDSEKLSDPSLIIYHPVRTFGGFTIITNGEQTETIFEYLENGKSFHDALRTWDYEPDAPNYTPRISGLVSADGSYVLSILKTCDGNPDCCVRSFFEYKSPVCGTGHFISTYQTDANPLPSFKGEPILIEIDLIGGLKKLAGNIWNSLNDENKVSIYAGEINLKSGKTHEIIINKNQ